jgi:hypothetical protein
MVVFSPYAPAKPLSSGWWCCVVCLCRTRHSNSFVEPLTPWQVSLVQAHEFLRIYCQGEQI